MTCETRLWHDVEAELVRRWDAEVALVVTPADLLGGGS